MNALTRNYSFIHDTYSDRYDFHYSIDSNNLDDYETNTKGYWGYIRDKKADRNQSTKAGKSDYDGFWGQFKDSQVDFNLKFSNELSIKEKPKNSGSFSTESESSSTFNYKISQLKIQARKREENSQPAGLL